jgi:hypothetical protein
MTQLTLVPDPFTLVKFDAGRVRELVDECAKAVDFPQDADITFEVDEALPLPLTATMSDVIDGRAALWCTGGVLEDPHFQGQMSEPIARAELAAMLLRAKDRLAGGFAEAPADADLSDRARAAWDVYADGRLDAIGGFAMREPRRLYTFRLYAGFNDVADAEYARLRSTPSMTWAQLEEVVERLAAADPRGEPKRPKVGRPTLRI